MTQFEYYSHNKMSQVKNDFTPALIKELKSFLVERVVDNMSTEDLVQYVTDDLDDMYKNMSDVEFLDDEDIEWCNLVREKVDSIIISQAKYDMECG